jgi:hypothetical protein
MIAFHPKSNMTCLAYFQICILWKVTNEGKSFQGLQITTPTTTKRRWAYRFVRYSQGTDGHRPLPEALHPGHCTPPEIWSAHQYLYVDVVVKVGLA